MSAEYLQLFSNWVSSAFNCK